jgi:hypothetical protein
MRSSPQCQHAVYVKQAQKRGELFWPHASIKTMPDAGSPESHGIDWFGEPEHTAPSDEFGIEPLASEGPAPFGPENQIFWTVIAISKVPVDDCFHLSRQDDRPGAQPRASSAAEHNLRFCLSSSHVADFEQGDLQNDAPYAVDQGKHRVELKAVWIGRPKVDESHAVNRGRKNGHRPNDLLSFTVYASSRCACAVRTERQQAFLATGPPSR